MRLPVSLERLLSAHGSTSRNRSTANMLASLLGWLPIVGPFIKAALSAFDHYQDATVQKAKIGADKDVAEGAQDVQVIAIRASHKDDIGIIFARDMVVNWWAVYNSLIFYDSCFRNLLPANFTWRILAIPTELNVLCTAIVAFMFYTAWRGK